MALKGCVYRRMKGEQLPSHDIFFFCRQNKREKHQTNKINQYMLLLPPSSSVDYFFFHVGAWNKATLICFSSVSLRLPRCSPLSRVIPFAVERLPSCPLMYCKHCQLVSPSVCSHHFLFLVRLFCIWRNSPFVPIRVTLNPAHWVVYLQAGGG